MKKHKNEKNLAKMHEDMPKIIEMYESGISAVKIAGVYGVGSAVVSKYLRKNKIKKPNCSKFNQEYELKIIEEYEKGLSTREIAKQYEISQGSVMRMLKKYNIQARSHRKVQVGDEKIIEMYQNGKSANEISKIYELSLGTIMNFLRQSNVEIKEQGNKNLKTDIDKIIEMYQSGKSTSEISEIYNVHMGTIHKLLKKHGVETKQTCGEILRSNNYNEIIEMYTDCQSLIKVAESYNVSVPTISKILAENSIVPSEIWNDRLDAAVETIIEMYHGRHSIKKISETVSFNPRIIKKILSENGLLVDGKRSEETKPKRESKAWPYHLAKEEQLKIIEMYKETGSTTRIAMIYNVCSFTVILFLRKNNLPIKTPKKIEKEHHQAIIDLYESNMTMIAIANKYDVSQTLIRKILIKNKVKIKGNIIDYIKLGAISPFTRVSKKEKMVEGVLKKMKINYESQSKIICPLTNKTIGYADFELEDKIVIEVNGTFWHCDPRFYPDGPIYECQKRARIRDCKKSKALKEIGYQLIEIWEKEIDEDVEMAVKNALSLILTK